MMHRTIRRDYRHRSGAVYSNHAADGFNPRLHVIMRDLCRDLADVLGDRLAAVVVGGSYGRGEGVCRASDPSRGSGVWSVGQAPRDPIHLLLVLRFPLFRPRRACRPILEKYRLILGVPISVRQCELVFKLPRVPHSFDWYEWAASGQVLYGPVFLVERLRHDFGFLDGRPGPIDFPPAAARLPLGWAAQQLCWALVDQDMAADRALRPSPSWLGLLAEALLLAAGRWEREARERRAALDALLADDPELGRCSALQEALRAANPLSAATVVQAWRQAAAYVRGKSGPDWRWRMLLAAWLIGRGACARRRRGLRQRLARLCLE